MSIVFYVYQCLSNLKIIYLRNPMIFLVYRYATKTGKWFETIDSTSIINCDEHVPENLYTCVSFYNKINYYSLKLLYLCEKD